MGDKAFKYVHVMNKPSDLNYFCENFNNVNINDYVGLVSASITNINYSGYICYEIQHSTDIAKNIKGVFQPSNYKDIEIIKSEFEQLFKNSVLKVEFNYTLSTTTITIDTKDTNDSTEYILKKFYISPDLANLLGLESITEEKTFLTPIVLNSSSYPFIFINEVRLLCDMGQFNEYAYLDNELILSVNCLAVLTKSNNFNFQCYYLSHLTKIIKDPGNIKFEFVNEEGKKISGLMASVELAFFRESLHTKKRLIIPNLQFDRDYMLSMEVSEIAPFFTDVELVNNIITKENSHLSVTKYQNGTLKDIKFVDLSESTYGKLFDLSLINYYSAKIKEQYIELSNFKMELQGNTVIITNPKNENKTYFYVNFGKLLESIFSKKYVLLSDTQNTKIEIKINMESLRYSNENYALKINNIYNDENTAAIFSPNPDVNSITNNYYYCFRRLTRNNALRFNLYKSYLNDKGEYEEKKISTNDNYKINLYVYLKAF